METSPHAGRESPSALALGQRQHGSGNQQPEGKASDENGHQADVHLSEPRSLLAAASISLVAVVQLLWVALLLYGTYWIAASLVS